MQRNMDLVREVLLATEASSGIPVGWIEIEVADHSSQEVSYHVELLDEAGLLIGHELSTMSDYSWKPKRLTWYGHEFLDTIREKEIWEQTKEGAHAAGGFSLDILSALAKGLIKKQVEKHTGLEIDL